MTATKTISLHMAPTFFQGVAKDLRKIARDCALTACARGAEELQVKIIPSLKPHPPINRRLYLNSWRYEFTKNGARLFNREKVAPLIEFGVRAENVKIGRAMIAALSEWVAMKNLLKDNSNASVEDRQATKSVQSVAWAIAKKMKRRGIFNNGQGFHVLDAVMPTLIKTFQDTWAKRAKGVLMNVKAS
jgi:hypothetical protein